MIGIRKLFVDRGSREVNELYALMYLVFLMNFVAVSVLVMQVINLWG